MVILAENGLITLDVEYIDGTKIESKTNRYTFVWRKTTVRNRARLLVKTLSEQIGEAMAQENAGNESGRDFSPAALMAIADELNWSLQKEPEPETKDEKRHRKEKER